jgi:hypothetical protein
LIIDSAISTSLGRKRAIPDNPLHSYGRA